MAEIIIPVESNWRPPYRLTTDGKYITLYGRDTDYPINNIMGDGSFTGEYEEMVLVPVVIELRRHYGVVKYCDDKEIIVELIEIKD